MIKTCRAAAFAAGAALLLIAGSSRAVAQTNAIANGNWSAPGTWSAGVPSATLPASINGGFTVTLDTFGNITNLLDVGAIPGETGTLTMNGGDLAVADPDPGEPNIPSLRVGQAAGSTGVMNMNAGTIFIDGAAGSDFGIGELLIGDVGAGTLNMTGGLIEANDEVFFGLTAGSTGVANVSGGEVKALSRNVLIGFDGSGTLNLSGTGQVSGADEVFLGHRPNGVGVANISGGRLASNGRSIIVGLDGDATMDLSGTGEVFANFDLLVGIGEGSNATITQSGGLIDAGFVFTNAFTGGTGSTVTMTQTGGTVNTRIAFVLGQGVGTTTFTHSGGAINAPTNNGDFVVGDGNGNTSTYNVSDTATVTLLHSFIVGAFGGSNGTVNQTGGTISAGDNVFVGRDAVGAWSISGGTVTAGFDIVLANATDGSSGTMNQTGGTMTAGVNVVVGRDGTGVWNLDGGALNTGSVFLGDFDSSLGTMKITGGALTLTGNFNVGGALASNAAPDRVEPDGANGPQGQALDANGVLIVSGAGATIDIAGNFRANPDDKSSFRSDPFAPGGDNSATLGFEIFSSSGTSLIDVAGVADLDGAVIDLDLMGGFSPTTGATFDLLTAASFGSTGTGTTENVGTGEGFTQNAEDAGVFSLAIVPGGNGEILRATFLESGGGFAADFDNDGDVDGQDLADWRSSFGPTAGADADADGDSDGNDFLVWQRQVGSGPAVPATTAIPEPQAALLLATALAACGWRRRR